MRSTGILLFLLAMHPVPAQVLHNINYSYQYAPDRPFSFSFTMAEASTGLTVIYRFTRLEPGSGNAYTLQWETRTSFGEKEGTLVGQSTTVTLDMDTVDGKFNLTSPGEKESLLVGKVISEEDEQVWYFPKPILPYRSVEAFLVRDNIPVADPYVDTKAQLWVEGYQQQQRISVTRIEENFPPASPPFAEDLPEVPMKLMPDTIFYISGEHRLDIERTGLYLLQQDTSSSRGLAFRIEDDYPRYTRLQNIISPLIYICTKQEFDKLVRARNDKKEFDQLFLDIAGDIERARQLLRSYFRRVEIANELFSSYKEGWKTDRGMMYLIFGEPDEVYKFSDREIWRYRERFDFQCMFIRAASLFDPESLVLVRSRKLEETWYETVDLWRKTRFQ